MLLYFVQLRLTTQMVCVCAGDILVAQPWAPARQISAGRLPQALHGVAMALEGAFCGLKSGAVKLLMTSCGTLRLQCKKLGRSEAHMEQLCRSDNHFTK